MFRTRNVRLVFAAMLALPVLLGAVVFAPSASALSFVGPDPADMGNASDSVGYVITTSDNPPIKVPRLQVPIYWTNNTGTKNVIINDANLCIDPEGSAWNGTGGNDADTVRGADPALGLTASQYYMERAGGAIRTPAVTSVVSNGDTCYRVTRTLSFDAATYLTYDASLGLYYGFFTAEIMDSLTTVENRFSIRVETSAIVGYSSQSASTAFAISHNWPRDQLRNMSMPFAPDCTIAGPTTATAVLYDLDNGSPTTQNGNWMDTYVEEIDSGGVVTRIPLTFTRAASPTSATFPTTGNANGYEVQSSASGEYVYVHMTVRPGYKYKLGLTEVYGVNVLQFQLPFDSINFRGITCAGPTPTPTPTPPPPPVQPIFKTTGGDVVSGVTIGTDTLPCATSPHKMNAGIASWNRNGTPNYAGAGGEYAAFALGAVKDYVTSQGTGQVVAGAETNRLTFANEDTGSNVDFPNGLFGGLFEYAPCVDYWDTKPADGSLAVFGGSSLTGLDGAYLRSSNITIGASTIQTGDHVTLYVKGDVFINGNITLQPGPWAKRTDIPSLRLIVNGSIFIHPSVTRLDGLYVAVPTAANVSGVNTTHRMNTFANPLPGTISTCGFAYESYNPADHLTSQVQNTCGSDLVINGSIVAQQLWLLRSHNGLAANDPAEVVNYTPETWLSVDVSNAATPDSEYQSIIGLPPIL